MLINIFHNHSFGNKNTISVKNFRLVVVTFALIWRAWWEKSYQFNNSFDNHVCGKSYGVVR